MTTVRLSDLNDFIAPSQRCVNPLFAAPSASAASASASASAAPTDTGRARVQLAMEMDADVPGVAPATHAASAARRALVLDPLPGISAPLPAPTAAPPPPKKAQVSLSDCLACSGCVTSAEAVLVEAQSVDKFVADVRADADADPSRVRVATLSPQARASIARRFGVSPREAHARLARLLRVEYGVACVLDAGQVFHDVSLLETAAEFVHRHRASSGASALGGALPMLSSSCPGWVCYAEKTQPETLPHLSTAKSAQQVAGALVKRLLASRLGPGVDPARVYHVTIMQCPDKKLEASRPDFARDGVPDVDCVLTATEVCDLMLAAPSFAREHRAMLEESPAPAPAPALAHQRRERALDAAFAVATLPPDPLDAAFRAFGDADDPLSTGEELDAGGSGGYAAFVFRYAAKTLFGVDVPAGPLPFRRGRNPDTWSVELELDGRVVLSFATAYGFRNIQDVVRKMRRGGGAAFPHHFVEMMACPGGCPNGGGQIPPEYLAPPATFAQAAVAASGADAPDVRKRVRAQEVLAEMRSGVAHRSPLDNPAVRDLYANVVGGDPFAAPLARELFHVAKYAAVPKLDLTPEGEAVAKGW